MQPTRDRQGEKQKVVGTLYSSYTAFPVNELPVPYLVSAPTSPSTNLTWTSFHPYVILNARVLTKVIGEAVEGREREWCRANSGQWDLCALFLAACNLEWRVAIV